MSALKVVNDNFSQIEGSDKTVLLDFYADWCGPCQMVSPIVEEIADEYEEYLVGKINVDKEVELARRFGIASIPTLIIMKNGNVIKKMVGAQPKDDILDALEDA